MHPSECVLAFFCAVVRWTQKKGAKSKSISFHLGVRRSRLRESSDAAYPGIARGDGDGSMAAQTKGSAEVRGDSCGALIAIRQRHNKHLGFFFFQSQAGLSENLQPHDQMCSLFLAPLWIQRHKPCRN